jgi:hypothetical protein
MRVTKVLVSADLLIEIDDCWGGDCTVAQVEKQAIDSALLRLRQAADAFVKVQYGMRIPFSVLNAKVRSVNFSEEK